MGVMLAIETSNPTGAGPGTGSPGMAGASLSGVAAVERSGSANGARVLGVEPVSPHQGDDLTPAIERLFRRMGIDASRIESVAVSVGPGGFTSVRIAVMTARMIALATGSRCYAVPTALALARRAEVEIGAADRLSIALAWKREDAWVARFRRGRKSASWTTVGPGGIEPLGAIGIGAAGGALVAEARLVERLRERGLLAESTMVLSPVFDPVAVAEAAGGLAPIGPDQLLPLYPREPEAVTKWRALHGTG